MAQSKKEANFVDVSSPTAGSMHACCYRVTEQNGRQRRRERERERDRERERECQISVKGKDDFKSEFTCIHSVHRFVLNGPCGGHGFEIDKNLLTHCPQTVKFKTFLRSGKGF